MPFDEFALVNYENQAFFHVQSGWWKQELYTKNNYIVSGLKGENFMSSPEKGSDWKKFLRKHWLAVTIFVVTAVLLFADAVYVFLWFVETAQTTNVVPSILGFWTMGNLVTFILLAVFWEFILVGIPIIIAAVAGWLWWRRLPNEEKNEYNFSSKSSRSKDGGNGICLLIFVVFALKVFIDGRWNVAISSWNLDYVINSLVLILVWGLIIVGILAAIGVIAWVVYEARKKPVVDSNAPSS